ncbi:MAG: polyphosphate glucokinase [Pontimonas sp.]|jgi:polyphosphate glucokinase
MTHALGIDIGGTGIKGARIDISSGELLSDRIKIPTPEGAHPADVFEVVHTIVERLGHQGDEPIGVCFPAVITGGKTRSASNISQDWIDFSADEGLSRVLGQRIHMVNDADAAGWAEARLGAAHDIPGLVILTTLGTGIGSALLMDGALVPNSELGILELDGERGEHRAANSARERENLSFEDWATRLTRFYRHVEDLFSPELFVIGGGISAQYADFFPFVKTRTPLVPATFLNNAGIIGSAILASDTRV